MVATSARFRRARRRIRLCGLLSLIAVLVLAFTSVVWCAIPGGRRAPIPAHLRLPGIETFEQVPFQVAANQNGRFQRNYREWQSLTPQEKETLRRRQQQLNQMPPQNRRHLQDLNERLQQLSPSERRQLQRSLDDWNNLSPSEKESIRRRFGN